MGARFRKLGAPSQADTSPPPPVYIAVLRTEGTGRSTGEGLRHLHPPPPPAQASLNPLGATYATARGRGSNYPRSEVRGRTQTGATTSHEAHPSRPWPTASCFLTGTTGNTGTTAWILGLRCPTLFPVATETGNNSFRGGPLTCATSSGQTPGLTPLSRRSAEKTHTPPPLCGPAKVGTEQIRHRNSRPRSSTCRR